MKQLSDPPKRIVVEIVGGSDLLSKRLVGKMILPILTISQFLPILTVLMFEWGEGEQEQVRGQGKGEQEDGNRQRFSHSCHHHPNF